MGLISIQLDLAFLLARHWGQLNIRGCACFELSNILKLLADIIDYTEYPSPRTINSIPMGRN